MIYVLADDLTGAAELAGIAKCFGLKVSLYTEPKSGSGSDVIVYSTNTRSMSKQEALTRLRTYLVHLNIDKDDLLYIKTDSVLRGYVADEFAVILETYKKDFIFYLPCNPSLGRTIQKGLYYVEDKLLPETVFFYDPEFPRSSASVIDLLIGSLSVKVVNDEKNIHNGICVGNASSISDIRDWAFRTSALNLLAGAGDFFEEILNLRTNTKMQDDVIARPINPFMFVSGTAIHKHSETIWGISRTNDQVVELDNASIAGEKMLSLYDAVSMAIVNKHKVIIAFSNDLSLYSPVFLRKRMAELIFLLLKQNKISELIIEGGSSAQAFLDLLKIDRWEIDGVYARGVIRMRSNKLFVTVKPGSYPLSENIIQLLHA